MSDAIVSSQDVLRAVLQLRRQGVITSVQDLEQKEPNLAEFLLEETTTLHHLCRRLGGTAKQLRQVDQRIYALALVSVLSLQQAHARLWTDEVETSPSRLDIPALPQNEPPQ